MEHNILIITAIIIGIITGFIIGKLFSQNRFNKNSNALYTDNQKLSHSNNILQEQLNSLQEKIEQNKNELKFQSEKNQNEKSEIINQKNSIENNLQIALTQKQSIIENLEDKLLNKSKDYQKLQEDNKRDFELLANKILEDKTSKFTEQNKLNIKSLLDPLQEKIQHFEKKVDDTNKESIERNSQLREQIFNLKNLNEQMSKEALNLTKALKGV